MTYALYLGDPAYSSWSLRGWLPFEKAGLSPRIIDIDFNGPGVAEQLNEVAPARTVPCAILEDSAVVWDSLALCEELAARHPDAQLWPQDTAARAIGRSLAAEMHSGFTALRSECPMHLRVAYDKPTLSEDTLKDVARIETIWSFAFDRFADQGPWLLGNYSIADIFYAPVAARFATYDVALSDRAQAYVDTHLSDPAFLQWRKRAMAFGATLPWYEKPFARRPWPGPA